MKIKTYRFAAALAVLIALALVFMAPVGAVDVATVVSGSTTTHYTSLQDAVDAAQDGETVTLLMGVSSSDIIEIQKAITLDGAGYTLTSTASRAINVNCSGAVTIKNLTVATIDPVYSEATNPERAINIIDNAVTLTLNNVTAEGFKYTINVHPSSIGSYINIIGGKYGGYSALNIIGNDTVVVANNVVFHGNNTASYDTWNNFGAIAINNPADNVSITINGGKIIATSTKGERQFIASAYQVTNSKIVINSDLDILDNDVFNAVTANVAGSFPAIYADKLGNSGYEAAIVNGSLIDVYDYLTEAVDASKAGDTIKLLNNIPLTSDLLIGKSVVIDGNGKSITGKPVYLKGGSGTIDVTLKNITVADTKYAVLVGTPSYLTIEDAILEGWGALYVSQKGTSNSDAQGDGSIVTIKKSVLNGTNDQTEAASNSFGTVVVFANNTQITVEDSYLSAERTNNNQSIFRFGGSTSATHTGSSISVVNSTMELLSNTNVSIFSKGAGEGGSLKLTIGEKSKANTQEIASYIPDTCKLSDVSNEFYTVTLKPVTPPSTGTTSGSSSSSSSKPTEPVEPETPAEPETPVVPGEPTVETEVTDGGEVQFEIPAADDETGEPGDVPADDETGETGDAPADEPAEPAITGVVLPEGTNSEVAFVPVSEQPAPAGKEENTKKVFEINVPTYEKGKPATVKFQMTVAELAADGKEAADVALWHFDEETGEWTKLVTSFVIIDGVVYFEAITFDFSPFAIIYEDEPVDEPVEEPETPESPAPVLGLLAALGAAVVLRRK